MIQNMKIPLTKDKNANIEIHLHPCVLESVPGTLVKQYKDIEQ